MGRVNARPDRCQYRVAWHVGSHLDYSYSSACLISRVSTSPHRHHSMHLYYPKACSGRDLLWRKQERWMGLFPMGVRPFDFGIG